MARKMVCEWGMSEKLGPLTFGKNEEHIFLGREVARAKDYSEETALMIDAEIKRIVLEAAVRARQILDENIEKLHALARALLERKLPVPISADTARPAPARAALEAGARVINDVSGLRDPAVAALVAKHHASVILMAAPDRGGPGGPGAGSSRPVPSASNAEVTALRWSPAATGQADAARVVERLRPGPPGPPVDPVGHVMGLLRAALGRARAAGIPEERIVVDPGIGFFRDEGIPWHEWDARVLAGLGGLNELGRPVCVGVSRKSFIGAITGRQRPAERLAGSLAATAIAVRNGAAVIRTHDPAETLDAIRVAERLGRAGAP